MTTSRGRSSRSVVRALKDGWPEDARAAAWLTAYRPVNINQEVWESGLDTFVRAQAGRLVVDLQTMKRFARVLARIGAWCVDNGIALDVETVLDPDTVERFLAIGAAREPESTVATWRSDLRRVGPALTKLAPWEPAPKALSRATLAPPYTAAELRAITRDAPRQGTVQRSRAVRAVVALGLGAGLDGRWTSNVRGSDVVERDSGVRVRVSGAQPRDVEVRDAYVCELLELSAIAGEGLVVGDGGGKNYVNAIARDAHIDQGRVSLHAARLRSTWLVAHLSAGTHVKVLLQAAGMESLGALRDLALFACSPTADVAAQQLRRA